MARKKRKKKTEFSKFILITMVILATFVTAFTFVAVIKTGDTSALGYLIPAVFAELATSTGFYYWKAKTENKIKLSQIYGKEIVDDCEVTEEI